MHHIKTIDAPPLNLCRRITSTMVCCCILGGLDHATAAMELVELMLERKSEYERQQKSWPLITVSCHKSSGGSSFGYVLGVGDPVLDFYPPADLLEEALSSTTATTSSAKCAMALLSVGWTKEGKRGRLRAPGRKDASFCGGRAPGVVNLAPGGLLAESGIKIGDRIVGLNGVRITRGQAQVAALLDSMTAPCTYEFVVRRARATADGTKDAELIEDEEQPNRGLAAGQPVGRPAKELTPATREPGRQYNKAPRPSGTWVNLVQN